MIEPVWNGENDTAIAIKYDALHKLCIAVANDINTKKVPVTKYNELRERYDELKNDYDELLLKYDQLTYPNHK
jgi:hypothetical protein